MNQILQNILSPKNVSLLFVIIVTIRAALKSKKASKSLKELLSNKSWLIQVFIIILFTIWISYTHKDSDKEESKNYIESIKRALVGFIIAIFAELGLTIAPFWFIFVLSYYFNGWI